MKITLNDFTSAGDPEKSRYLLMNKLLYCKRELDSSRLYPTYQMLIEIHEQLTQVLENYFRIYQKEIEDSEINDTVEASCTELEKTINLMEWALQQINESLETAKIIYDFVDENITIEPIGLDSPYNREGYIVIPDKRNMEMKIVKYSNPLHMVLKTKQVDSFRLGLISMPGDSLKNIVISLDILNQIIYHIDTELSFPFKETIMPVAKRKFLHYLENRNADDEN